MIAYNISAFWDTSWNGWERKDLTFRALVICLTGAACVNERVRCPSRETVLGLESSVRLDTGRHTRLYLEFTCRSHRHSVGEYAVEQVLSVQTEEMKQYSWAWNAFSFKESCLLDIWNLISSLTFPGRWWGCAHCRDTLFRRDGRGHALLHHTSIMIFWVDFRLLLMRSHFSPRRNLFEAMAAGGNCTGSGALSKDWSCSACSWDFNRYVGWFGLFLDVKRKK